MELLIGCGNRRDVRVRPNDKADWAQLLTADLDRACNPDFVIDLNAVPWTDIGGRESDVLDMFGTVRENAFDEVHAYEVLEHLGRQGDALSFFTTFAEIWRVLKPGGLLCATVPALSSPWLWGDPGHTRVILPQSLTFLVQPEYTAQVGRTPMTDYREQYSADFEPVDAYERGEIFSFVMRAVKPARIGDLGL